MVNEHSCYFQSRRLYLGDIKWLIRICEIEDLGNVVSVRYTDEFDVVFTSLKQFKKTHSFQIFHQQINIEFEKNNSVELLLRDGDVRISFSTSNIKPNTMDSLPIKKVLRKIEKKYSIKKKWSLNLPKQWREGFINVIIAVMIGIVTYFDNKILEFTGIGSNMAIVIISFSILTLLLINYNYKRPSIILKRIDRAKFFTKESDGLKLAFWTALITTLIVITKDIITKNLSNL